MRVEQRAWIHLVPETHEVIWELKREINTTDRQVDTDRDTEYGIRVKKSCSQKDNWYV